LPTNSRPKAGGKLKTGEKPRPNKGGQEEGRGGGKTQGEKKKEHGFSEPSWLPLMVGLQREGVRGSKKQGFKVAVGKVPTGERNFFIKSFSKHLR